MDPFVELASYNRWANARLYGAAFDLPDEAYRRNVGAFFGSLNGTLNHLLVADRIWLHRLTGEGPTYDRLDAILHDDLPSLAAARAAEDDRLVAHVEASADPGAADVVTFRTTKGVKHSQPRSEILLHLFNHQTHHRGQAHTILSIVTGGEPPSLDLLQKQRNAPAPDLADLAFARR